MENLLEEFLQGKKGLIKVKKLAKIAGMIGSFSLAMGNVCRFHTRKMMSQIVSVAGKYGRKDSLRLDERVMIELMFWKRNLRELNGWDIPVLEVVVYCRV